MTGHRYLSYKLWRLPIPLSFAVTHAYTEQHPLQIQEFIVLSCTSSASITLTHVLVGTILVSRKPDSVEKHPVFCLRPFHATRPNHHRQVEELADGWLVPRRHYAFNEQELSRPRQLPDDNSARLSGISRRPNRE